MSAKMIRLLFILGCSASWMLAQSSPGTATPPAQTATPPARTAHAAGTSCADNSANVSAKQPEWIAADYSEFRFNELGQRLLGCVTDEFRSDVGINRERHKLAPRRLSKAVSARLRTGNT
jgi:hypothetical protein